MKNKPILIVAGEPKSVFFEILFKSYKSYKIKSPLIIIASKNLLLSQIKKFKFKKEIRSLDFQNFKNDELDNKKINLIDIKTSFRGNFKNNYIENSFDVAFRLIKKGLTYKLINGPIKKTEFPLIFASPPTIALSSAYFLSPCKRTILSNILLM